MLMFEKMWGVEWLFSCMFRLFRLILRNNYINNDYEKTKGDGPKTCFY